MSGAAARLHIIAIGQIPPPVTGYAYITECMVKAFSVQADVETINTSPNRRQGLLKHTYRLRQTILGCWRLIRFRNSDSIAYIGCEGDWGLIYTTALIATARLSNQRTLLHHHSFSYIDRDSKLMKLILRMGGKDIRHIFLCTIMRSKLEKRYGKIDTHSIISNAAFVNDLLSTEQNNRSSSCIRIGLLSNLTREKGLYIFLDLVRRLKGSDINVRGLLAGPVTSAEDRAHIGLAESELGDALKYIGPIYGEAKDHFYGDIDIFVFPTQYANEAQPTVLFEALAFGNKIVTYDRGCIRNQVGSAGLVIPPNEDFCARASEYIEGLLLHPPTRDFEREVIARDFKATKASALLAVNELLKRLGDENSIKIERCP